MICQQCQKEIAEGSNFCYFCGAKTPAAAGPAPEPVSGEPRRLVRNLAERKLGGVCAGLADYMDMDVSLVRVLAVISVVFYGVGLMAYLVAWIVIPEGQPGAQSSPTVPPSRRLHRSANNRKIGGVCGGVAEFLDADPSIIRIIWLVSILVFGSGLFLYLLLWFILPLGDARPSGMQAAT